MRDDDPLAARDAAEVLLCTAFLLAVPALPERQLAWIRQMAAMQRPATKEYIDRNWPKPVREALRGPNPPTVSVSVRTGAGRPDDDGTVEDRITVGHRARRGSRGSARSHEPGEGGGRQRRPGHAEGARHPGERDRAGDDARARQHDAHLHSGPCSASPCWSPSCCTARR